MSAILPKLVWLSTWPRYRAFVRDTKNPRAAQERVWREIWSEIRGAELWKDAASRAPAHGGPPPLEEFELTTYENYRPALEASFPQAISKLSGQPIIYWSESSATSGKRKLFPITELYRRQFQRTTPPLLHALASSFPRFLSKPVLYFAGLMPAEKSPAGVDLGFISNFNYRHIPRGLQKHYAFPLEVFRNWETFSHWAGLYAVATDLSAMIGISPSVLLLFAETLERRIEVFWPYLEGKAQPPAPLPPVSCSPERLEALRQAFAKKPFSFREVWPSLEFVCCWKTASCALQLPRLEPYLQKQVPTVDATYSATEGWVNVPVDPLGVGGPVHPGAHVFEFLKAGDEPRKEKLKKLWELEQGESYEVVLTTAMGLVRYRLADLVRCTGFFNRTPIVEFTQKATAEIRLGLSGVSEAQLIEAMGRAGFAPAGRWVFGPNAAGDQLVVYHDGDEAGLATQAGRVHAALLELNPYYRRDITRGLLKPLGLMRLPEGHAAFGSASHAQAKPRLLTLVAP